MKKPINIVVPVTINPNDPSIDLSVSIQLQNFGESPEHAISIRDAKGDLRPFEEIQTEYAQKAIAFAGNNARAATQAGISRQTLSRWLQPEKK